MKIKTVIRIRKRTQPQFLTELLILLPFCFGTLTDLLHLPSAVRYLVDLVWCALAGLMLLFHRRVDIRGAKGLLPWVLAFFLSTLVGAVLHYQSALYYLWGFRNTFRIYAAFFAFAAFLTAEEIPRYLDLFDRLFWLNGAVSLIQFFAFGIRQDNLGGIFGVASGVNGTTNLFFLIVITKSVTFCLEKRESLALCIGKCAVSLLIAAMAELKFYFVEFLVVLALAVLLARFTWRKFWLILGGIGAVLAGAAVLTWIFPSFTHWLTLEWFWETAFSSRGYTSSGDLNRLTALSSIDRLWLRQWHQRLLGLGLGNCETSSVSLLNTPFFRQHGHMHYSWMSHAFVYLECGWLGLGLYFGIFAGLFLASRRIGKCCHGEHRACCRTAGIVAVLCCLISVYNASLRTEAGFLAAFVLAIPFVLEVKTHETALLRQKER